VPAISLSGGRIFVGSCDRATPTPETTRRHPRSLRPPPRCLLCLRLCPCPCPLSSQREENCRRLLRARAFIAPRAGATRKKVRRVCRRSSAAPLIGKLITQPRGMINRISSDCRSRETSQGRTSRSSLFVEFDGSGGIPPSSPPCGFPPPRGERFRPATNPRARARATQCAGMEVPANKVCGQPPVLPQIRSARPRRSLAFYLPRESEARRGSSGRAPQRPDANRVNCSSIGAIISERQDAPGVARCEASTVGVD